MLHHGYKFIPTQQRFKAYINLEHMFKFLLTSVRFCISDGSTLLNALQNWVLWKNKLKETKTQTFHFRMLLLMH